MMLVASKIDIANKDKLAKLKRYAKKHGLDVHAISAVTGKGIDELKYAMAKKVEEVRATSAAAEPAESADLQRS
jgi:GTP-binding protein